jgi:hypothetical protein
MRSSSLVFWVLISRILIELDHTRVFNSGFRTRRRFPLLSHISQARFVLFPYWVDYTMTTEEWHKQEKVSSPRANEASLAKRNGCVKVRGRYVFLAPFSLVRNRRKKKRNSCGWG